jgi:hypothetical protein
LILNGLNQAYPGAIFRYNLIIHLKIDDV